MVMNKLLHSLCFLIFLLNSNKIEAEKKFHACGSYCGPYWCNNMWLSESNCNGSVLPEYDKNSHTYSCPDSCCRNHDMCCGQNINNKTDCNREIVKCLKECGFYDISCKYNNIGIPAFLIAETMFVIENWCCGEPCYKI